MGDVLSRWWRAGAGIAVVLALAGCEGVPTLTFAAADASDGGNGSSDAGGDDAQVDASDGDDGSSDTGASDAEVEASVIDASGCRDDGGGQPPPNATTCCGGVPCTGMGNNCALNCSRCMVTCIVPGQVCCAKTNTVMCRFPSAGACP